MSKFIDLTGKRFERLTVMERIEDDKNGSRRWKCKCDCGNITIVRGGGLESKETKSCGCLRREQAIQTNKKRTGINISFWTTEEMEFLKVNYPIKGLKFCANKLNKSCSSVGTKANSLNIKARSKEEIINLFNLSNLSVMCKSCNSSKQDKDYNIWMKSKSV